MSGVNRLDAPSVLLLERAKEIAFRFEGKDYRGLAGDTLGQRAWPPTASGSCRAPSSTTGRAAR